MHPIRRRRALERVQRLADRRVIFICTGNICRSPFAEFWMRQRDPERVHRYTSAGIYPGGRTPPDTALVVSLDHFGVDMAEHRSRALDELPDEEFLWVVMEKGHYRGLRATGVEADAIIYLGDLDPGPERREIMDPYGRDPAYFEATYRRIERCLNELAGVVAP